MERKFANITKKIIMQMPFWFNIKKDPQNSIGADFLDVFGVTLDEVQYVIDYAYKQTNIRTADVSMLDIAYKCIVPQTVIDNIENTQVIGDGYSLKRVHTVEEFFLRPYDHMIHPELNSAHIYYLNEESMTLYTLMPFRKFVGSEDCQITFIVNQTKFIDIPMHVHMVWNYFDEFGYLLSCPRLYGEKNLYYKERLLDIFKNKPGATEEGVLNAISRELGLTKTIDLTGQSEIELKDPMIVVNKIKQGGQIIPLENITLTERNTVLVKVEGTDLEMSSLTYNAGIEMHRLNNKEDYSLHRQLFKSNLTPTELLKQYAKTIQTVAPIMWGQFKFDESYWDIADEDMLGYGCLAHISDASIEGFRWYTKENPRNTKPAKLVEIIANDLTMELVGTETEITPMYTQVLKSINTYPAEIVVRGGEVIELSYHGANG